MTRSYFPRQCWALSGILIGMAFLCVSIAAAQAPSIEGTYQLISRTLSDGTVLKPPNISLLLSWACSACPWVATVVFLSVMEGSQKMLRGFCLRRGDY